MGLNVSKKLEYMGDKTLITRTLDDKILTELTDLTRDKCEGTVKIERFCQEFELKDIVRTLSKGLGRQNEITKFFE